MAASLIESLAADFVPAQFHDEYRDAVADLITLKRSNGDTRPGPVAGTPSDADGDSMTNLLAALQRSVEAARADAEPATAGTSSQGQAPDSEKPEGAAKPTRKARVGDPQPMDFIPGPDWQPLPVGVVPMLAGAGAGAAAGRRVAGLAPVGAYPDRLRAGSGWLARVAGRP